MKKVIERIVKSEGAPLENDLWLDPKTNELKHYENEEWKTIAGGESSGGDSTPSDSGCNCHGALIVEGTIDVNYRTFYPNSGQPSLSDVMSYVNEGAFPLIKIGNDIIPMSRLSSNSIFKKLEFLTNNSFYSWIEGPESITIQGTVENNYFTPSDSTLNLYDIYEYYTTGIGVINLSYNDNGETKTIQVTGYIPDFHDYQTTDENVYWKYIPPYDVGPK